MFDFRYDDLVALKTAKLQTEDWIVAFVKGDESFFKLKHRGKAWGRGVSKRVEDGRRPSYLWAGHP
jgi:hypothetical protein